MRNRLLSIALLFLGGLFAGNALAAGDAIKQGGIGGTGSPALGRGIGGTGSPAMSSGIGGTGSPAMNGGIGGTGSPAMNSGIGGTGLRPDGESAALALAGKVLFIVGQVEAQNQGQIRQLAKGEAVRVGDTLKSAKGATLQLRMADGGTIVLRPESQLAIESFVYKGVQDGSEHLALALLGGGFRAVTGEIGHLHKENYSIRTPNAKVGILGTDHETVFVSAAQPQMAGVEPGTYNHVISGATVLQSEQGKLLIKPNQTGFAALNGASPVMVGAPSSIFGEPKINSGGEHHGDSTSGSEQSSKGAGDTGSGSGAGQNSSGQTSGTDQNSRGGNNTGSTSSTGQNLNSSTSNTDQNLNGSTSGAGQNSNSQTSGSGQNPSGSTSSTDQNSRGVSNTGSLSGSGQNSNDPTQSTQQNRITQPDHLANTSLDLNTLDSDATPAPSGSAIVGAHMSVGLQSVGSAQAGNSGETLFLEKDNVPVNYSNNTSGFNFVANEGSEPINTGTTQVDGVTVTWGIYAGGTAFDTSGNAITINFHPFAFANGGATPTAVISSIGGTANFSTVAGYTPPVTESGNIGGSITLNVGINLSTASLTSYILGVADANSRNWTGTLNGSVPLATFAQSGAALAVTCSGGSGASCGSGTGSGMAAGMLVGPNAKGLISSYVLSTTTGQAVAGTAIMSRP